jgi:hypothetical protein
MSSDLVILGAAASQLFECTRDMSREAVVSLLSGLRDVSLRNIPAASTTAVGQQMPKLFALNRMVEVLLYNINRIYDLWAIFLRCGCCWLLLRLLLLPTSGCCWALRSSPCWQHVLAGARQQPVFPYCKLPVPVLTCTPLPAACLPACLPPIPPAATCWR